MKITITESEIRNVIKQAVNEAFNKRSIINKLYRLTEPYTRGKYHDSGWKGVDDIINALRNAGYEVYVSVKDGGYRNSRGGNTLFAGDGDVSYWKEFDLEIPVEDKVINGQVRCHAAGTVDDVFSSYDQTCRFW
jgi:hypothetical protein